MHRPVIITSRFVFLFLSESQIVAVQEAFPSSLAALPSPEAKLSLARKDPGAPTSCKYS